MGAENAKIMFESYATLVDFSAIQDSGDHLRFRSDAEYWSAQEGQQPTVRPNGVVTGGVISPSSTDDTVAVSAARAYVGGSLVSVASESMSVTRGSTKDCRVNSVTITAAGVWAVVAGAEGDAISDERGAAGGPPWIPTGSVEVGQVRLTSRTAGVVAADEIKQGINVHQERYDFPVFSVVYMEAENGVLGNAGVDFASALPLIHSDDDGATRSTKKVYVKYYVPEFVEISEATGFSAAERSYNVGSTQIYSGVKTSVTASMGQAAFTVYLADGISDSFLRSKNKTILVKFVPDRNNPDIYRVELGKLGVKRTWPASGDIAAACTLSPIMDGIEVIG